MTKIEMFIIQYFCIQLRIKVQVINFVFRLTLCKRKNDRKVMLSAKFLTFKLKS